MRRTDRCLPGCVVALLGVAAIGVMACAEVKPVVRSIHDVAKGMCALFFAERQGLSLEEAASTFCATEAQLRPFIEHALEAQQTAGAAALSAHPPPK
jgi:hypothetical protein